MANYTEKAILKGFEEMLNEMSFSKITVSALISKCEISSNTFYYHYRDIYDLLDTWLDRKRDAFFLNCREMEDHFEMLKAFFRALKEHPKLVYHVSDSVTRERLERYVFISLKGMFYRYVEKAGPEIGISEDKIQAFSDFCCYTFLGMTLEYIWGRMDADADAAVDRMRPLFNGMLQTIRQGNISF